MARTTARLKEDKRSIEQKQDAFLNKFCDLANITKAAKACRVGRRTVYDWLENDKNFKAKFKKARKVAVGVLEDEAHRRAVEGVDKPIFYKGKRVKAKVKEYSDTLLIVLLKANAPKKYRERVQSQVSGPDGGPIQTESTVLILPSNGRELTKPNGQK
jgi:hypothetical protein